MADDVRVPITCDLDIVQARQKGRQLAADAGFTSGDQTVIVGIQPEVAFAMVQLGLTLKGVATALDLEEGLAFLDRLKGGRIDVERQAQRRRDHGR